jgi:Calcineurin-like phosphoesterase
LIFKTAKIIIITIAFAGVFSIFTSSLFVSSENFAEAKPDKESIKKNIEKAIKKLEQELTDNDDKRQEEREEEEREEEEREEEKIDTDYDYKFTSGGEELQDFNFAVAGDFGCSQNAKDTIRNMGDKKPELVLPLGDLSVEDNTGNCWLDLVSPFDNRLQITFGYHDINEGTAKLDQYKEVFGLENLYYSFDFGRAHFIVMSTLTDYNVTSDQYKFIEKDLKVASENENVDWIVVTSYAPFYTSPSEHPAKKGARNIYHPLFDTYGVDIVLTAHNHNYQRTYPITFNADKGSNPTVTNGFTTGYFGNKDGIIYAVVGTAGEGPVHPLASRVHYVATQFEGKYGFLNIEISNDNPDTKLTGTFYDNKGDNIADYFTIQKEIKNKNPQNVLVQYQGSN